MIVIFLSRVSMSRQCVIVAKLFILFLSTLKSDNAVERSITLNAINFNDLAALDVKASILSAYLLSTVGMLRIVDVPGFARAHGQAFETISQCLESSARSDIQPSDEVFTSIMNDGSKRMSIGAKSSRGLSGPMSHACGKSANNLRSLIDTAMRQLFLALDKSQTELTTAKLNFDEYIMKPYRTFQELTDRGEHLEHLHSYINTRTDKVNRPTMELHTDAGLLIAMTAGYYTHPRPSSKFGRLDGLFVELPCGELVHVETPESDLVVMVGEGGGRWLSPRQGGVLRPVPHLLRLDLGEDPAAVRNWYGKMYLPPSDAELHNSGITYAEYRARELSHLTAKRVVHGDRSQPDNFIPSVCGGDVTKYTLQASAACTVAATSEAGLKCWAQCMSVGNLSCGQSALCIDTFSGNEVDGTKMCRTSSPMGHRACQLQCPIQATVPTTSKGGVEGYKSNGFCLYPGASMSMSGFMTTSTATADEGDCVVFLLPTWVLDDTTKFVFASLGTFFGGILVHALSKIRNDLIRWSIAADGVRQALLIVAYAVQITLSYLLMLVAMTYNTELFIMVCLGLTVGYSLFNREIFKLSNLAPSPSGGKYSTFSTTSNPEPCCPQEIEENAISDVSDVDTTPTSGNESPNRALLKSFRFQLEKQRN